MRIQILPLPPVMVGDDLEEPFALIVDQAVCGLDEHSAPEWESFKTNAGARALLVTAETVEIVDPEGRETIRIACLFCDNGEASAQGAGCVCTEPCWNRDCPKTNRNDPEKPSRSRYATNAVMYDKRVVIDWPDGPPPGVSRRDLQQTLEKFAHALAAHMAAKDGDQP